VEVALKPESHLIETLRAVGNVVAVLADDVKSKGIGSPNAVSRPGPGDKVIKSPQILAFFGPEGNQVSRMEARGPSVLEELPDQPNDDKRILSALELTVVFEAGSNKIDKCMANRDVKLTVIPAAGPIKKTSSDHLVVVMDKQTHQIGQVNQTGDFQYQEEGRQASSEEARYFSKDQIIRLEGHPQVSDASSKTRRCNELHQLQNLSKPRAMFDQFSTIKIRRQRRCSSPARPSMPRQISWRQKRAQVLQRLEESQALATGSSGRSRDDLFVSL
jgi:hypothetical protein